MSTDYEIRKTPLAGALMVRAPVFTDARGTLAVPWQRRPFSEFGIATDFRQEIHSQSSNMVLRGLHYQLTHPMGKLISVQAGEIFDVAVDLRRSSPTFGHWHGVNLSASNRWQYWVPPGFAHGYLVTSDHATVNYKCTAEYDAGDQHTIAWDDSELAIDWPLADGVTPLLSDKDQKGSALQGAQHFP